MNSVVWGMRMYCHVYVEKYIEETGRSLGEKAEEHEKSIEKGDYKSALIHHQELTGHTVKAIPMLENLESPTQDLRSHQNQTQRGNTQLE